MLLSGFAAVLPAKLGQAISDWRALHLGQVENWVEDSQYRCFQVVQDVAVVYRNCDDPKVLVHPKGERRLVDLGLAASVRENRAEAETEG